jgi:hypothetical protein
VRWLFLTGALAAACGSRGGAPAERAARPRVLVTGVVGLLGAGAAGE